MTEQEWLACDDPAAMLEFVTGHNANLAEGVGGGQPVSDRKLRLFACACCRQAWHLLRDDAPCPQCQGKSPNWTKYRQHGQGMYDICEVCSNTGRVNRSRRAVEVAERYADGQTAATNLLEARVESAKVGTPLGWAAHGCCRKCPDPDALGFWQRCHWLPEQFPAQADLLRDIVGNPFRPAAVTLAEMSSWLLWNDGAVHKLACVIYDERRFGDLPILADALEEAGCDNADILQHCRNQEWCIGCSVGGGDERYYGGGGGWCSMCDKSGLGLHTMPLRGPHVRGCWVLDLILGLS